MLISKLIFEPGLANFIVNIMTYDYNVLYSQKKIETGKRSTKN